MPVARQFGPVLLALGLVALAAGILAYGDSPFIRWMLYETLAPARVLPLVGLGVALGLLGGQALAVALLAFALGLAGGFVFENRLLALLDLIPQAATHNYMTGPLCDLAVGAALLSTAPMRVVAAPLAAAIVGALLALIIRMTDPSLHEAAFTTVPILIAIWIVLAVALTLRRFRRDWFDIPARILGGWLVAIALLYGGASLVPPRTAPQPPPSAPPQLPADKREQLQ